MKIALLWVVYFLFASCGMEVIQTSSGPPSRHFSTINSDLTFTSFGDWGDNSRDQREVAQELEEFCDREACDFIFTLGDNFYDLGVRSVDDPRWEKYFKSIYSGITVPFYAILGNHDHDGNVQAQIDYTTAQARNHQPQWVMPDRQYNVTFFNSNPTRPLIEFFVIDSQTFIAAEKNRLDDIKEDEADDDDGEEEQEEKERELINPQTVFLIEALASSNALWKIVAVHHPLYSNGNHGDTQFLKGALVPVICNEVDVVLSSHDHNFAHLDDPDDGCRFHQFVVGTGGKSVRSVVDPEDPRAFYWEVAFGFTSVQVNEQAMHFRFHRSDGKVSYTYTLEKAD